MAREPVFSGITQSLAKSRLEAEGTSSIFRFHSRSPKKVLRAIFDPFTAMVALGCVALFATGGSSGWRTAIILAALLAGLLMQRWRAKIRLERWREWATCRPQVIRDGRTFRIPHSELVREDLVLLEEGDRVPAEAELLAGSPIELSVATPMHEMLAPGSVVTRGSGVVRIRAAKPRSRDLPAEWIEVEEGRGAERGLLAEARDFLRQWFWITVPLSGVLLFLFVALRKDWSDGVDFSVGFLLAAIPAEMPALIRIFAEQSAARLLAAGIAVRDSSAIEGLSGANRVVLDHHHAGVFLRDPVEGVAVTVLAQAGEAEVHRENHGFHHPANHPENRIVSDAFDLMDDAQIARESTGSSAANPVPVFQGLQSKQKSRLLRILRRKGERVILLGDSVQDQAVFAEAEVSIAPGYKGPDSLREKSQLVLLRDDAALVREAVMESRCEVIRMKSAIAYLASVRMAMAGAVLLPMVTGLPPVFLPLHLVVLAFVLVPFGLLVFVQDPAREMLTGGPVRAAFRDPVLLRKALVRSLRILASLAVVGVFAWFQGKGEWDVRALMLTTFVFANAGLMIMGQRTLYRALAGMVAVSVFFLVLRSPELCRLFEMNPIHPLDFGVCLVLGGFASLFQRR